MKNLSSQSGRLTDSLVRTTSEDVGAKVVARDLHVGDVLDCRPPLSVEQNLASEPIRNGLLADRGTVHELGDASSKLDLALSDLDGALKSGNVRFLRSLHDSGKYTNRFVSVNNPACVTKNKEACTVLQMPTTKRKSLEMRAKKLTKAPSPKRVAKPGPDGFTLGQRLRRAMDYHAGKLQREYDEADLCRDVNRMLGADMASPVVSQQLINAILNNKVSRSHTTAYFATICGVRAPWLSSGAGPMLDS